jgi:sensor histidine kinase YesM
MKKLINQIKNNQFTFWPLQIFGWGLMYVIDLSFYFIKGTFELCVLYGQIFIFNLSGILLTSLLRYLYQYILKKQISLLLTLIIVLFCAFIVANIWAPIAWFFIQFTKFDQSEMTVIRYAWTIYSLSSYILAWSALYFGIKYWQDFQIQKEQTLKATALAHKAQLQMLRYQLNPHFLFNALNSVRAMIKENHEYARQMISEISEFLRYTLVNVEISEVLLKEEINAIRNYLSIEKIRFEDELEVTFNINKSSENYKIPGFLIHPLVENAIKHGMQTSPIPLKIEINAKAKNGKLAVDVVNTGYMIENNKTQNNEENSTRTGLQNVRKRLEQVFPGKHKFGIYQENGWVHANFEIDRDKVI